MIDLTKLARNDLTAAGTEWYQAYLTVLDAKDLDAYGALLADNCVMYVNNDVPIEGKPAILGMLGPYWQSFGSLVHEPLMILGDDRAFMLEALNHYERLDGSKVSLRAVAITERDAAGLACGVRLYSDTSPLFAKDDD